MPDLARQQCLNHPGREAVVRCPSCRHDFCRECVTEHDDRYLCTACLSAQAAQDQPKTRSYKYPIGAFLAAAGLLSAWLVFYTSAQYLILSNTAGNTYRVWHAR